MFHSCKWLHPLAGNRQGRVRLGLAGRSLSRGRDVLGLRGTFCFLETSCGAVPLAGGVSVKQDTPENSLLGLFVSLMTQDTKCFKTLRAAEVVRAANML